MTIQLLFLLRTKRLLLRIASKHFVNSQILIFECSMLISQVVLKNNYAYKFVFGLLLKLTHMFTKINNFLYISKKFEQLI